MLRSRHYFPDGNSRPNACLRLHTTVTEGQVVFRLLCGVSIASGVIGPSGSIVKKLQKKTTTKIRVEDAATPQCKERLIYIVGSDAPNRTMKLNGHSNNKENGGEIFHVSAAQEALIRVLERVLEVEAEVEVGGDEGDSMACCKLLAVTDQVAAAMGRRGKRMEEIKKTSGAVVEVLPQEELPLCADSSDALIQITGETLAVKKAVVAVSHYLQETPVIEKTSPVTMPPDAVTYEAFQYPNTGGINPRIDEGIGAEVVFRFLCPCEAIGGVIGKGGQMVRAIEDETGATIRFLGSMIDCYERVITVSAFENPRLQLSPAQDALMRLFSRTMEIMKGHGMISGRIEGEFVTSRLLVPSSHAGSLIGVRGAIISNMRKSTGAAIHILRGNHVPYCAFGNEYVVQIVGPYSTVQHALFEVTCRLRENVFSNVAPMDLQVGSSTSLSPPHINHTVQKKGKWRPVSCRASSTLNDGAAKLVREVDKSNEIPVSCQVSSTLNDGAAKLVRKMDKSKEIPGSCQASSIFNDGASKLARKMEKSNENPVSCQASITFNDGATKLAGKMDKLEFSEASDTTLPPLFLPHQAFRQDSLRTNTNGLKDLRSLSREARSATVAKTKS